MSTIVKSVNTTCVLILSKLLAYLRLKYFMKDFVIQKNFMSRILIHRFNVFDI